MGAIICPVRAARSDTRTCHRRAPCRNSTSRGRSSSRTTTWPCPSTNCCRCAGRGLSEKASLRDNLIVHGDNLAMLKSLLPTYHGKVKCVYIDPPYNTGNEGWAYNDNVNSPLMRDWLGAWWTATT